MMKRSTVYLVVAILLAAGPLYAARVTNIQLSHQDNTTVARIDVEGQVRFTHQTEIPKDDKPHRLIVDILTATHDLGAQSFHDLPACGIKAIRTSQFAVNPEKIVRVVFDMDGPPLYRIESNGKSVIVSFTDKSTTGFATWSSQDWLKANSNTPAPKAEAKPTQEVAKAEKPAAAPATKDKPAEKKTTVAKAPAGPATMPPAPTTQKAPATDKKAETPVVAQKPAEQKSPEAKPAPAKKQPAKVEQPKPSVVAKKPAEKPAETKVAEKPAPSEAAPSAPEASEKPAGSSKSTSRFRRNPAQAGVKGTMVAEFPKRLVIKYQARSRRDPFETLINDTKQNNSPLERQVPNIEGLRLVGIIEAGSSNRALFEDKDGYGYILKSGDKVKNGYVLRVESDRVYFQIFEYGWSRTVALQIEY
jgi:hypothetical protein